MPNLKKDDNLSPHSLHPHLLRLDSFPPYPLPTYQAGPEGKGKVIVAEMKTSLIQFSNTNLNSLKSPLSKFPKLGESMKKYKKAYDGLLLDAGGTLLQLSQPVEHVYLQIGKKYGLTVTAPEIKQGFKRAFSAPWPEKLRYQGDGKPFWKLVVSEATGCADDGYFNEVYEYYANGHAWHLPDEAHETLLCLKNSGVKLAVVSNFDTRLRKLLKELNVLDMFDAVLVSSEVGFEKPDAQIYKAALDHIGVDAEKAVHVGDDEQADKKGANAIGIDCWLWGKDVKSFSDIRDRILVHDN